MNWNFSLIYKNEEDFQKDYEFLKGIIPTIQSFAGKLNDLNSLKEFFALDDKIEYGSFN